jgi:hypothetical protein
MSSANDGSTKGFDRNDSSMNVPQLTTVDGAYQYLIGILLILVVLFGLLFGGMYLGYLTF